LFRSVLSQTGQTMGISGYKIYSSESPDGEDMQLCASTTEIYFNLRAQDTSAQHNFFWVKACP
ncbi:MAG: hypothetical protein RBS43_02055, partial [Candidatus Cloacimonas sp.]|nr:hypothetical protein [Candidatus Cloacimonas sp.]